MVTHAQPLEKDGPLPGPLLVPVRRQGETGLAGLGWAEGLLWLKPPSARYGGNGGCSSGFCCHDLGQGSWRPAKETGRVRSCLVPGASAWVTLSDCHLLPLDQGLPEQWLLCPAALELDLNWNKLAPRDGEKLNCRSQPLCGLQGHSSFQGRKTRSRQTSQ